MTRERDYDGATNSNDRQCLGHRPGRLGDSGNWSRAGGRRGGLGVAAVALSAGPALVGEAVVVFFGEDEMVEESNPKEVAGLAQSFGQDAIFGTGRDVPGRMIMGTEPGTGIHEDQWFEDFAGMDNRQVQRARRDDIYSDELVLGVQTTDEELLSVQTVKQWPEDRRSAFRRMNRCKIRNGTTLAHERDTVPRDRVFPNRAQWPSTVRGTESTVNGHVRLLLKLWSSPTLHQPRVGRNEGGGAGLSQRAGLEGGDRHGGDREGLPRCSPASGRTRMETFSESLFDEIRKPMSGRDLQGLYDWNQPCKRY